MADSPHIQSGIPKDQFLARVRRSLGRPESSPAIPPQPPYPRLAAAIEELHEQGEAVRRRLEAERVQLTDQFAEVAQLRGWNLYRTANPEEAIGYIADLAADQGVEQVARSAQAVFDDLPLDSALENLGIPLITAAQDPANPRELRRQQIIDSGIGVTGVDYAVAETGSVVVLPRRGLSRLVSLVPPVHIAVVRPQEILASLDDVFLLRRLEYHQKGGDMGSYLNFITGPSRTADIEMQLVIGVHGPKEVHLVLLG